MDLARLREPFPSKDVEWRITNTNRDKTKGMVAAYVDARAIMDRLDDVCGPENWQVEYRHVVVGKDVAVIARLSIRTDQGWIAKEDGADQTETEAVKGGISSALRRAGVPWGIARYLYNLPNQWVDVVQKGTATYIADGVTPRLPDWALPESERGGKRPQQERPAERPQAAPAPRNMPEQDSSAPTPLRDRVAPAPEVRRDIKGGNQGWMKALLTWAAGANFDPLGEEMAFVLDGIAPTPDSLATELQEWMDTHNAGLPQLKNALIAARKELNNR